MDVFTLLELAAENLQELFRRADVCAEIPETGEVSIRADMEWTMEANTAQQNTMEKFMAVMRKVHSLFKL